MKEEQKRLIEKILEQATKECPVDTALEAIGEVYNGKLWVVGGFISSLVIPLIHGYEVSHYTDLDILLAQTVDLERINMPGEWTKERTFFGYPRFSKEQDQVDIWCLPDMGVIRDRGLEHTIHSYLRTVPLTTQSLAYDIEEGKIYDDVGFRALETRMVGVNDLGELRNALKRSGEGYLQRKAKKLKFASVLDF